MRICFTAYHYTARSGLSSTKNIKIITTQSLGSKDMVQFLVSKVVLLNKEPITTMRQVIKLAFSVFIFELFFRSGNCHKCEGCERLYAIIAGRRIRLCLEYEVLHNAPHLLAQSGGDFFCDERTLCLTQQ
jgi:predicted metal-binding protein